MLEQYAQALGSGGCGGAPLYEGVQGQPALQETLSQQNSPLTSVVLYEPPQEGYKQVQTGAGYGPDYGTHRNVLEMPRKEGQTCALSQSHDSAPLTG